LNALSGPPFLAGQHPEFIVRFEQTGIELEGMLQPVACVGVLPLGQICYPQAKRCLAVFRAFCQIIRKQLGGRIVFFSLQHHGRYQVLVIQVFGALLLKLTSESQSQQCLLRFHSFHDQCSENWERVGIDAVRPLKCSQGFLMVLLGSVDVRDGYKRMNGIGITRKCAIQPAEYLSLRNQHHRLGALSHGGQTRSLERNNFGG